MARKQVFRDPTSGSMVMEDLNSPGGFRELTDEELPQLRPSKVLDEMGVSDFERFTLKNFATSPAQAQQFLVGRGYEVMQMGDGLNFATRRSAAEPWRVVDPNKGGMSEFFRDMIDHASDVGAAFAFGAGVAAGGGVASLATGAATAALIEGGRQVIGQNLGIPDNIDPLQIGVQGAIGGATGPVLSGIGKAVKGVGGAIAARAPGLVKTARQGVSFVAGRIAGVEEVAGLTIGQAFVMRAERMLHGKFTGLPTPIDVVDASRVLLREVGGKGGALDALTVARNGLVKRSKAVMDVSGAVDDVINLGSLKKAQEATGALRPAGLQEAFTNAEAAEARGLSNQISAILGGPPGEAGFKNAEGVVNQEAFKLATEAFEEGLRNTPVAVGLRLKALVTNWVNENKGFIGVDQPGIRNAISEELVAGMRTVGARLQILSNKAMGTELRAANGKTFAEMNDKLSRMIDARFDFRKVVGDGVNGAESFISSYAGGETEWARRTVRAFDKEFGYNVDRLIGETTLGLQFTKANVAPFGEPSILPRLGATGQFIGPSIVAGATTGGGVLGFQDESVTGGGLAGAAGGSGIGFLIGLGLASPQTLVRSARVARPFGEFLTRRAEKLAGLTLPSTVGTNLRAAGMATVASIAKTEMGKAISRQDSTAAPVKKEVLRFVGE